MSYVTLCLSFNIDGDEARRVLSIKDVFRKIIYEIMPNCGYADGVIVLARGIYGSCG